jgi:hypothetical protein
VFEGKGRGGPRDGIKLTAGPKWDGRVRLPGKEMEVARTHFYPGFYKWTGTDWLWIESDDVVRPRTTTPRPRIKKQLHAW